MPWWAWPSALALDAPAVGAGWLCAVAWQAGTPVAAGPALVLTLSIWLVYMADRLLDARRLIAQAPDPVNARTESRRHAFAIRHARALVIAWLLVLVLDLGYALSIYPAVTLAYGVGLTALSAIALGARLRSTLAGVLVRSGLVGIVFAAAVAMSLGAVHLEYVSPALVAFAAVCAANVVSVTRWEHGVPDGVDAPAASSRTSLSICAVILVGSLYLAVLTANPLVLCAAASAGLLVALHAAPQRLPTEVLRLSADAALLLPLAALAL